MLCHHVEKDIVSLKQSSRASVFAHAALGAITSVKPYSDTLIGKELLSGLDRKARSTLMRFLAGDLYLSEYRCPLFKRASDKRCPYCKHPSRTACHFLFECAHFSSSRNQLFLNLAHIDPQLSQFLNRADSQVVSKLALVLAGKPPPGVVLDRKLRAKCMLFTASFLLKLKASFVDEK